MRSSERRANWRRNEDLERLLGELAELLAPAEAASVERAPDGPLPLVLVVGPPRGGTTLVLQWLAATGLCAYPTNLLARFWAAPSIGARVQQLLLDPRFAFRDELADLAPSEPGFESDLGKTRGALAPSEFWYFWRRFLPGEEIAPLGARTADVDAEGLRRALAALTGVLGRPFAAKGMMLQYDLPFFGAALPEAIFVHVERDVVANARSLLTARERFFGTRERWYSAKPPEYVDLLSREPEEQVVGQVVHTNRAITEGLAALPPERGLALRYEDFCADPAATFDALRARLAAAAPAVEETLPAAYAGPQTFRCTNAAPDAADPTDAALTGALRRLAPTAAR